jgi:hypothetical protein
MFAWATGRSSDLREYAIHWLSDGSSQNATDMQELSLSHSHKVDPTTWAPFLTHSHTVQLRKRKTFSFHCRLIHIRKHKLSFQSKIHKNTILLTLCSIFLSSPSTIARLKARCSGEILSFNQQHPCKNKIYSPLCPPDLFSTF